MQELGLQMLTRLRVQAQLEEANEKLAASTELLVKIQASMAEKETETDGRSGT